MSQCLDYAFDMDAEIEPMPAMDNDFGNDFDDLTQEDHTAISISPIATTSNIRKHKITKPTEKVRETDLDNDPEEIYTAAHVKRASKFKKRSATKRWNPKKIKLSTDLCPSVSVGLGKPASELPTNRMDTDDGYDFESTDYRAFYTEVVCRHLVLPH